MNLGTTDKVMVINDSPVWVWLQHPNYTPEVGEKIIGKWVHHDTPENLERIALDLTPLIGTGILPIMKYCPTRNKPGDYHEGELPPLCAYVTPETMAPIFLSLREMGLKDIYWRSNEDTSRDFAIRELYESLNNNPF